MLKKVMQLESQTSTHRCPYRLYDAVRALCSITIFLLLGLQGNFYYRTVSTVSDLYSIQQIEQSLDVRIRHEWNRGEE